ncbi:MAG: tRNA uridine-5-carboxymethylaminomethyl(34) synthesis enzyme MnmG [Acidaminococcales bacterium]|nr:tRNA uridine-5-carboxymethylaminomethyl(34) synthesis enzyme MnmG [Acidaminococcales bacterium]
MADNYDVVVIGGGPAGCEAALASARLGAKTLMATISMDNIGFMPCNPSIGGPAKGHLVREVDALGGQMGIIADQAAIQTRVLNKGKGPAVQALRIQADKALYQRLMKQAVEAQENLDVKQLMIDEILLENGAAAGVRDEAGEIFAAGAVVVATGTYLRSRIIYGAVNYAGGPNGMRSARRLSVCFNKLGLKTMRFKSGTPARVDKKSLDFGRMQIQPGDEELRAFSFLTDPLPREQVSCWLTYTNEQTHRVIKDNLSRAAMFNGQVEGIGPRYCPSIETKIVRFADKSRHQLFVEPEGTATDEMYVQGMSTSLPADVQVAFLRTIPGLEKVKMMRAGYAIDYDCLDPLQLNPSLEHKEIAGLFSAGQSNGTSGYEEAAAQGIVAGINAARKIRGQPPFLLSRADAYIGVLIDDLVTKGTDEPYRMMTSRAEYRLLLQHDNADLRLTEKGRRLGLVDGLRYERFRAKHSAVERALAQLSLSRITPAAENSRFLRLLGSADINSGLSLAQLLKRPEIRYRDIKDFFHLEDLTAEQAEQVETRIKYADYIQKQKAQVEKNGRLEGRKLPPDMDYHAIKEIAVEAREKLARIKPASVGQAARVPGVSPADINMLLIWLKANRNGDGIV